MEAINSDKFWEEIKNLLRITLCNTSIHTYTLCFMDIQQQEKESLAASVHWFKTKAKRCNFINDNVTIMICVKGLKSGHNLATCIYKRGPQTLTDASQKWRSLMLHSNSQQWSSHLPQSMWCQTKRTAVFNVKNQDTSLDIVLTLGNMNATNMVISSWTAHTKYLLPELQRHITNHTKVTMPNWVQGTTVKAKIGEANPDHSPTIEDIIGWVIMIHIEVALEHNAKIDAATTEVAHNNLAQHTEDAATDLIVTHHTGHIAALQVINCEIIVGHIHTYPTYHQAWIMQIRFILQQDEMKATSQEEHEGEDRRPTHWLLQLRWSLQWLGRGARSFKLIEPSASSDAHEQGGLPLSNQVTVALIKD